MDLNDIENPRISQPVINKGSIALDIHNQASLELLEMMGDKGLRQTDLLDDF